MFSTAGRSQGGHLTGSLAVAYEAASTAMAFLVIRGEVCETVSAKALRSTSGLQQVAICVHGKLALLRVWLPRSPMHDLAAADYV